MKWNKFILVSIFLLMIISLGAVCAADNLTADKTAEDNGMDELQVDSSYSDDVNANSDDIAISNDVNVSQNSKLSSSNNELLSDPVTPTYNFEVDLPKSGTNYVAQWGQSIIVKGTVVNATGNVTITFADETYNADLENGAFQYEITKYSKIANNQALKITYNGDDNFKTVTQSLKVNILLDEVVANGADYGQIAYVDINLYNATGTVNITYNNKNYTVELVDGKGVWEVKNYTLGTNSLVFNYFGDDKYNSISRSLSFTIVANIDEPTFYNLQSAIINAYLGGATGKVNFTYNNQSYVVDIVNGVATQEFTNYTIGKNSVTVSYLGDDDFNPFTKTISFTVLDKQNATILASVYQNSGVNVVSVYIPYAANGTVNVTINGKKYVLSLTDGQALYEIGANDDIYNIKVVYDGNYRLNAAKSSSFIKLNNVVTGDNWFYYFNQADNGKFFSFIPAGITLDFQGTIKPTVKDDYYIHINKPVNIISSTGDSLIDLNTTAGSLLGEAPGNSFIVSRGGSGSNISNINLHNTELWISNTSNVVFDNISNVVEDQRVGSGVGATSVRDNSSFVIIKNSYFYTRDNGGSTTFTFSWANNCTFDNNTLKVEGNVGNVLYLNIWNIYSHPNITSSGGNTVPINYYNKFTNNVLYGKEGSAISIGIMVEGIGNIIENNTLYKCSISQTFGAINPANNIYIGNILQEGSSLTAQPYSTVYNNIVPGTLTTGTNSIVFNNTAGKMTVSANSVAYNNSISDTVTLSGANATFYENTVNGAVTLSAANLNIYNNNFLGDNTIKFNNANAKNINFTNNNVIGYIQYANAGATNGLIANNTIVTSNDYAVDLQTYSGTNTTIVDNILSSAVGFGNDAVNHVEDESLVIDNYQTKLASIIISVDNIKVGQTAVFNVVTNETSISSVTIYVGIKKYTLDLVNGEGTLNVSDLTADTYEITVVSNSLAYTATNTTELNVTKSDAPEIVVNAPENITYGVSSNIIVTIEGATGNVTLSIDGVDVKANLVNGIAKITIPELAVGNYNYTITYSGDYKYLANSTNSSLTVNKNRNVNIDISNVVFNKLADKITFNFTDCDGVVIPDADVTIVIGDKTYDLITDDQGQISIDLSLTRGKYPVYVTFEANDEFDETNATANIIVKDSTLISIVKITNAAVSGYLKDVNGKAIANAKIIYTIAGGSKQTVITGKDGSFTVKATKNGVISFNYAGDEISLASSASVTLSNVIPVVKKSTTIKASNKKFKLKAKKKIVSVYLLSGKTKLTSKVITIKVKGKTYKAKTNKKGLAKFNVKLSKKGKFAGVIKFAGDSSFKASSKKIVISIVK